METMYFNNVQGSYCYVSKLIFVTLFLNSSWWVLMLVASAKVRWRRVPAACNRGGPTYTNPSACPPPPWPFKHLLPYYTGHPACFTYIAPLYTRHTFRTYMSRHLHIYIYILSRNPSCMLKFSHSGTYREFLSGVGLLLEIKLSVPTLHPLEGVSCMKLNTFVKMLYDQG